jgi:hypothetical protein
MSGKKNLSPHETATAEAVEGPSNRSFGLIVGSIFLAIAGLSFFLGGHEDLRVFIPLAVGAALVILALAIPQFLTLPNKLWMGLGMLLGLIMTPVVMGLVFALAFIPIGLAARLGGKDPLRRKRRPAQESYWVERTPAGPDPKTMQNQF